MVLGLRVEDQVEDTSGSMEEDGSVEEDGSSKVEV